MVKYSPFVSPYHTFAFISRSTLLQHHSPLYHSLFHLLIVCNSLHDSVCLLFHTLFDCHLKQNLTRICLANYLAVENRSTISIVCCKTAWGLCEIINNFHFNVKQIQKYCKNLNQFGLINREIIVKSDEFASKWTLFLYNFQRKVFQSN